MDIESSTTQQRSSFFARLKSLPMKAKDKIVNVGNTLTKLGKDDPRRVIHSLKVGFALTLVSLIYYLRPLYDGFGVSGLWAVLTVVVVFEFSVGATLGKGLNRGLATLFAAALGLGALHFSTLFGKQGEPIVLGILVFLLAGAATFTRFIPSVKARYDYGVLIFILTFSMIAVSGYRVDELLEMAHQRFTTILIGGAACILISIFVYPVWAGQDLHNLIASNIDKLANYLEGFGGEYFHASSKEGDAKNDKSFLQGYKSVLNTKSNEETLANFAKWEPGHGKFLLRHPWNQYLKIGGLVRQCAYRIETLSSHLTSQTQAPEEFMRIIEESCTKMSSESGKAMKSLATSIKTMEQPKSANEHVENAKKAAKELKFALENAEIEGIDLLEIVSPATVAALLCEIVECVEKISSSVHDLSQMAHFKKSEASVSPDVRPSHALHRGSVQPIDSESSSDNENNNNENDKNDHVIITVHESANHVQKPKEEGTVN